MATLFKEGSPSPRINAQHYPATEDNTSLLRKYVTEQGLEGMSCCYVLNSQDYILTLVDTPNVTKEEMNRALQWVIREMISYPLNEAIMDSFQLPLARARDGANLSYVTVIRKTLVQKIETMIGLSGLKLKYIDIPELALRNIAHLFPEENKGILFVYLFPEGGKLIVCREGNIYIARSLDLRLEPLIGNVESPESKALLEQLSLEIQRSLDYASTTFRQQIVNSVLVAPSVFNQSAIQSFLKTVLGIEVQNLDLASLISVSDALTPEEQAKSLPAIGGALRKEGLL